MRDVPEMNNQDWINQNSEKHNEYKDAEDQSNNTEKNDEKQNVEEDAATIDETDSNSNKEQTSQEDVEGNVHICADCGKTFREK